MKKHSAQPPRGIMRRNSMVANSTQVDPNSFRGRITQAIKPGGTNHDIYRGFGYPENITFGELKQMFRRGGIADKVVKFFPQTCWSTHPEIKIGDSIDPVVDQLNERFDLFDKLQALDERQRVGRYAGLFVVVKDDKKPEEPLEATNLKIESIVELRPMFEDELKPGDFDQDQTSPRYGQPTKYSMKGYSIESSIETSIDIHWTRIIIAAEGSDNGTIYGTSALENVYNSILDAQKIIGSGAEGFYKNAAQNVVFGLHDPKNSREFAGLIPEFNKQYNEFAYNRMDRAITAPGLEATVLDSTLGDPNSAFKNAIADIASGSNIPAAILIGEQAGRLASDENSKAFLHSAKARRVKWCNSMIKNTLNWFVGIGVLKAAKREIVWDDLLARSDNEKLESAEKMALVNEKQFRSGAGIAFDSDEIREAAGYITEPQDTGE